MAESEVELPVWVERVNRRIAGRRRTPDADDQLPPRVGEIWLAEPPPGVDLDRRLVCVVEVDSGERTVRAILLSNESEMASRRDVLVPGAGSGLPFDLLAEAPSARWLWWSQLERRVGRLGPRWLELVVRAIGGAAEPAGGDPPPAVESPREAVRAFQRAEREQLRALAAPCESARAAAHGDLPVLVDPRLLDRVRDEEASARARTLVRVAAELAGSKTALVPIGSTRGLLDTLEEGAGPGPDLSAAVRPLLEGALSGLALLGGHPDPTAAVSGGGGPSGRGEGPLDAILSGLAAASCREIVVLTGEWGSLVSGTRGFTPAAAGRPGGPAAPSIVKRRLEVHP
jgi:hypothetical protein